MSELILVKNEALYAVNNLRKWMQPQRVERNLVRQQKRLHIFAIVHKLDCQHSIRLQQTTSLFCQRRLEFSKNVAGCMLCFLFGWSSPPPWTSVRWSASLLGWCSSWGAGAVPSNSVWCHWWGLLQQVMCRTSAEEAGVARVFAPGMHVFAFCVRELCHRQPF